MDPKDWNGFMLSRKFLAVGCGFLAFSGPTILADDGPPSRPAKVAANGRCACGKKAGHLSSSAHSNRSGEGSLGFGLKFHPGFGYGGKFVGVGPEGGYPFYGGPGYPHPGPCLNRCGKETPFTYFGGPGFPMPENPNFYGEPGALALDEPVIESSQASGQGDYGNYTGLFPYPESTFAPFTTELGTAGSAAGINSPVAPTPNPGVPTSSTSPLSGVELTPVGDASGKKGLKVLRVQSGSVAQSAGLRAGDEIRSANQYVTEKAEDLAWIATHAASDNLLRLNVWVASSGQDRSISVRLR